MSNKRYQIIDESTSGHCCFGYTVWDTTKPLIIGNTHYKGGDGQLQYEAICECFNEEEARLVCSALNKGEEDRK